MREIKFRGKRLDNGEWVYGNYVAHRTNVGADELRHLIICNEKMSDQHSVDPKTLGEYTGLNGKNGKGEELYAGDILKGDSSLGAFENDYPRRNIGVIVWDDQKAVWCLEWQDGRGFKMRPLLHEMISRYNRKIGNVDENPDLLEAK